MVDLAIGGAIAALKTAGEMTGSFLKLRDEAKLQATVIELQSVILTAQGSAVAAQAEQMALLEEIGGLKKKVADLEAWERQKERYQLEAVGGGGFAYSLKPEAAGSDPPHKICAYCYEHGRRSVLMEVYIPAGRAKMLRCQPCGAEIITEGVDHRPGSASGQRGFRPLA